VDVAGLGSAALVVSGASLVCGTAAGPDPTAAAPTRDDAPQPMWTKREAGQTPGVGGGRECGAEE
jgi:hypothetical protein